MSDTRPTHAVACHCGTVRFRVRLGDEFTTARRCSCSYCRMRGAIAVSAALADIEFVAGEDNLTLYQFNTGTAKHHFCKTCGIYTHHQRRSDPTQFGINVACIEGVSPFDFPEVPVMDGVAHPSDTGTAARVAGILRYEPTT
ncbi:MAG: GFA family protein [Siculibacillus sp.]|nr:GFA family protein [Siculibacillus sp.]